MFKAIVNIYIFFSEITKKPGCKYIATCVCVE